LRTLMVTGASRRSGAGRGKLGVPDGGPPGTPIAPYCGQLASMLSRVVWAS
jgi:hypothetical protein